MPGPSLTPLLQTEGGLTGRGIALASWDVNSSGEAGDCARWRDCDVGVVLRRFRYALEPLCLGAVAAFVLARWVFPQELLRGWFTDVLLMPAALPVFLWAERRLGLRKLDGVPSGREILFYFVAWSVASEAIAPRLFSRATGDWLDVVWYGVGAAICWGVWTTSARGSGCRGGKGRERESVR